jgi:hypothetical protein
MNKRNFSAMNQSIQRQSNATKPVTPLRVGWELNEIAEEKFYGDKAPGAAFSATLKEVIMKDSKDKEGHKMCDDIIRSVKRLKDMNTAPTAIQCYTCFQYGHIAPNCPKKGGQTAAVASTVTATPLINTRKFKPGDHIPSHAASTPYCENCYARTGVYFHNHTKDKCNFPKSGQSQNAASS